MDWILNGLVVLGLVLVIEGVITIWRAHRIHEVETMWREAAQLRREAQMLAQLRTEGAGRADGRAPRAEVGAWRRAA